MLEAETSESWKLTPVTDTYGGYIRIGDSRSVMPV